MIKEIDPKSMTNTMMITINYIKEMIEKIHFEIRLINKTMQKNKNIYFLKSFRAQNCSDNLNNLELHKKILNDRLEMLTKLTHLTGANLLKSTEDEIYDVNDFKNKYNDFENEYSVVLY